MIHRRFFRTDWGSSPLTKERRLQGKKLNLTTKLHLIISGDLYKNKGNSFCLIYKHFFFKIYWYNYSPYLTGTNSGEDGFLNFTLTSPMLTTPSVYEKKVLQFSWHLFLTRGRSVKFYAMTLQQVSKCQNCLTLKDHINW